MGKSKVIKQKIKFSKKLVNRCKIGEQIKQLFADLPIKYYK
jgi:hypothetical protein